MRVRIWTVHHRTDPSHCGKTCRPVTCSKETLSWSRFRMCSILRAPLSSRSAARWRGSSAAGSVWCSGAVLCGSEHGRNHPGYFDRSRSTWGHQQLALFRCVARCRDHHVLFPVRDHAAPEPRTAVRRRGIGPLCGIGGTQGSRYGLNPIMAILLGMLTGIGGGMACDVLLAEIPIVLRADLYAVAALAGAAIVVIANMLQLPYGVAGLVGAALCFGLRVMAIHHGWRLPVAGADRRRSRGTDTAADP
jgi:glycine transporter